MLVQKPFQDIITFTRASAATRFNASGVLETVGNNVPRIDFDPVTLACRGLLIEEQRTNFIKSSTIGAIVGVIGAGGALPVGWGIGSVAGLTREILAIGTLSNGLPYVDIRISGTNTSGSTGFSDIHFLTDTSAAALVGQAWTASVYIDMIAGSRNGFSSQTTRLAISERDSGGVYLTESSVDSVSGRTAITRTLIAGAVASVRSFISNSLPAGATVDVTYRISAVQLERGPFATSWIPTTGAQATRASSDCKISTLSPWFSQQGGVLLLDYLPMGGDGVVAEFHNTANNRWGVTRAANGDMTAATVSAGTADGSAVVAGASPAGQIRRAAVSLAANDLRISVNGGAVSKDASVSLPVNLSVLQLGARQGLTTPFNGWLRKVRYIPKPVASDAELQALSTI